MITRKLLNQFASNAVRLGPAGATHLMLSDWKFQNTPVMDNSAPSAYTDRAILEDGLSYAEFSDIVSHVLRGHPDQPSVYSWSNKTEAGLMALRVFDRMKHVTERDVAGFCEIFDATTKAMIALHDSKAPWFPVLVPWMREILETNLDLMPTHKFKRFVHESSLLNRHYVGGNEKYLDSRIFADDQDLKFSNLTFLDQGLRALVNNCFGLKIGDHISMSQAAENEVGVFRLARVINDLHKQKVTTPAYQKNLVLTGELLTILAQAGGRSESPVAVAEINRAIQSLVDMTMTPVRRVGQIRENRLRPRYTAERLRFWSTTDTVNSFVRLLPRICLDLPIEHQDKGVRDALHRFRSQVGHDAYQALQNMTQHMANKKAKDYPLAYFKLAVEVSPEDVGSQVSHDYLSKLESNDLAELISTLSNKEAKLRLMRQHPAAKGAVLMNELGM